MQISRNDWEKFRKRLAAIDERAAEEMASWLASNGGFMNIPREDIIDMAYALATKYGEASASLSALMYDKIAELSKVIVPPAEVADTVQYGEMAKAVNGILKNEKSDKVLSQAVSKYTKRAGADTMLKNARRDGVEFAWVPGGDGCSFCEMLASRGWQRQSKAAMEGNHAEHIHANCDCAYMVRFDKNTNIKGYDPEKYLKKYYDAEGDTPQEKLNSMRRIKYQENKDKINAQKRINYKAKRQEQEKKSRINEYSVNKNVVGTKEYRDKFSQLTSNDAVNVKLHDKALDMLDHRGGTDYEDMYLISLTDGLVKGTQTKVEYFEKVSEELRHQHVWYNESLDSAIKNNTRGTLISIHNHPGSLPPSGGDFESQFINGYKGGVIACHNGDVYYYQVGKERFTGKLYDMTVDKYVNQGYSEQEAYEKTLEQFTRDYGITWRKL